MRKIIPFLLCGILLIAALNGCAKPAQTADNGKINIVATIFPEYDFARAIAGDRANITMLMSPGASVHSFDPSPSDIIKIQNADVFIYIGGESDAWVDTMLDSIDTSHMKIIRLMDHIDAFEEEIKEGMEHGEEDGHEEHAGESEHSENEEHEEEPLDEHIWTSLKNAIILIDAIRGGICEKDSANTAFYTKNATNYQNELKKVDEEITNIVSTAKRKKIIVADKFPFLYFVRAYGLDYEAAFPGCSDQADAGAKTIAHLIGAVAEGQIPYIYHVELSNKSVAEAIAEQTGAEMLLLNSCHNLSKEDFDNGATYLSLMQQNAENLKKGLN